MCPLELYSSVNIVRLGRFDLFLPSSRFLKLTLFFYPFLGDPMGPAATKSILSPSGATVSPGV